jgi:hypothetical protein
MMHDANYMAASKHDDCNFLLVRPCHGEHMGGPRVLRFAAGAAKTRECTSILTKSSNKHALYFKWLTNQSYLNNILSLICCRHCWQRYFKNLHCMPYVKVLYEEHKCSPFY